MVVSKPTVLVAFSGGMDSATLLAKAVKEYGPSKVLAVSAWYGSKHNPHEMAAGARMCERLGVERTVCDFGKVFTNFKSDLLNSGGAVPEGHYTDQSMSRTVVPCRNLIFASVMAGLADSLGAQGVWLGVHAGDHCLPAGTPVCARRGRVDIEDLVEGVDEVMSFDRTGNKLCWRKVVQVTNNGRPSTVLRFVTKSGAVLECTSEHKVYVVNRSNPTSEGYTKDLVVKRAWELVPGDMLVTPAGRIDSGVPEVPASVDLTTQEGFAGSYDEVGVWFKQGNRGLRHIPITDYLRLVAWYVTEGYATGGGPRPNTAGVYIPQSSTANPGKLEEIIGLARAWGFDPSVHGKETDTSVYFSGPGGKVLRACGALSRDKRLPEWFLGLPNVHLETLFRTMVAGDGYVLSEEKDYHNYITTSRHLIGQMAYIGSRLGYKVSLSKMVSGDDTYSLGFYKGKVRPNLNRIGEGAFSPIVSIETRTNLLPVFDIGVDGTNNFFAGHGVPVLVSNSIYPDCRPEFAYKLGEVVALATESRVWVTTPFLNIDKADILRLGTDLGVDYSMTRTCYTADPTACGRCGSCVERLEAFASVGVEDPLPYKDREAWRTFQPAKA